jgi:hypothetical protein
MGSPTKWSIVFFTGNALPIAPQPKSEGDTKVGKLHFMCVDRY